MFKRILFISTILFVGINYNASSQSFYVDYKNYLTNSFGNKITLANKNSVIENISLLRQAIQSNEAKNKSDFFQNDTIYIVTFQGLETGFVSGIIWNKTSSCYYKYSYGSAHNRKDMEGKTDIKSYASDILKLFNHDFRKSIEKGDNNAYYNYITTHEVFDGEWVSPLICIRKNGHWKFIPFKGGGRAINYDFELPKK